MICNVHEAGNDHHVARVDFLIDRAGILPM